MASFHQQFPITRQVGGQVETCSDTTLPSQQVRWINNDYYFKKQQIIFPDDGQHIYISGSNQQIQWSIATQKNVVISLPESKIRYRIRILQANGTELTQANSGSGNAQFCQIAGLTSRE